MSAIFNTSGGNTTVTFTYTSTTTRILNTVTDAAHELHLRDGGTEAEFSALTNQQKLDIVDVWFRKEVVAIAKGYYREAAKTSADSTATTETETRYL